MTRSSLRKVTRSVGSQTGTIVLLPLVVAVIFAFGSDGLTAQGDIDKGAALFNDHCVECHGTKGDGSGAVGKYLEETPADLLSLNIRKRSDQELFEIIKFGVDIEMHGWEGILSDQNMRHIVKYLRVLAPRPPVETK